MSDAKERGGLTLADIARLAGVSRSAASRALDRTTPTSGAGPDRVRAVAREHGYVPNAWAANLRKQRTGIVGVVVPRLTDTVMAMLYEALAEECAERGYQATVVTTGDDRRVELERGRMLLDRRVDGLVVTTARTDGLDPFVVELRERAVPYVLTMRTDGVGPAVVSDDCAGGRAATRHLIEAGHRRIAFVGGAPYASSSQGREAGYRAAMQEAGLPVPPELVHASDFSIEAGVEIGSRILALADVPTAVFAVNDSLAVGLISTALGAGLSVPEDLSIVGYNDTPIAARLATPLTSVTVPFRDLARQSLAVLLDGAEPSSDELPAPALVARRSVAPPRLGKAL